MKRSCVPYLAVLALLGWVSSAQADPINQLVVFGDSCFHNASIAASPPATSFLDRLTT